MSKTEPVSLDTALHVRDTCLCFHTQRAARALARRFDEAFRPLGLTNGQFSLLMALSGPEPRSMGMVATVLAMDRTTLTAALKPLERRGLVSAGANPRDRRARMLRLTGEGCALLTEAVPIWRATHAQVEEGIEGIDGRQLREALLALAEGG